MSEKMYEIIYEMIKDSKEYWLKEDSVYSYAFSVVLDLLKYAHENNLEALSNFDFFPIDKLAEK